MLYRINAESAVPLLRFYGLVDSAVVIKINKFYLRKA
ncbi:hypothetical protein EDC56_1099 [Sinobacterium caligoides]|uniref:Uncharacterized protein n=1 Tax=Sinobacterium caligoides TaxID=933926 RepID=A0A3N2E0C7_9GAMM|nr:hypothetical protein EDC56_1099 [Sinobacterium caligoides]